MTLRFNPGSTLPFLSLEFFIGSYKTSIGDSYYLPWCDTLCSMSVVKLTCVEHHKVSDRHALVANDGFIFEDFENPRLELWYNQYPAAAVGGHETDWTVSQVIDGNTKFMISVPHYLKNLYRGILGLSECPKHCTALNTHYNDVVALLQAAGYDVKHVPLTDADVTVYPDTTLVEVTNVVVDKA